MVRDPVDLVRKEEPVRFTGPLEHAAFQEGRDESVPVVRNDRLGVGVEGFFERWSLSWAETASIRSERARLASRPPFDDLGVRFQVLERRPAGRKELRQEGCRQDFLFEIVQHGVHVGTVGNLERIPPGTFIHQADGGFQQFLFAPAGYVQRWG